MHSPYTERRGPYLIYFGAAHGKHVVMKIKKLSFQKEVNYETRNLGVVVYIRKMLVSVEIIQFFVISPLHV
jgi:hypothetical protein